MKVTYQEIAAATRGKLLSGEPGASPERILTDTRELLPGDCFLALRGKRYDGHNFVAEAFAKRAGGVILSDTGAATALKRRFAELAGLRPGTPIRNRAVLQVEDTARALSDVAAFYRTRFKIQVIALTGSNGKTTTKDLIARILSSRYKVLKTIGNQNNHIGVPLTLLKLRASHQAAVIEMGMNHKGEIAALTKIARPTICAITNAGPAHLEFLKSVGDVARAKGELLTNAPKGAISVLNRDDPSFAVWRKMAKGPVITFGTDPKSNVRAEAIVLGPDATPSFQLVVGRKRLPVTLHLTGLHQVSNALCAVAVGQAARVPLEASAAALREFVSEASMRMAVTVAGGVRYLNDAYNANPASVEAALRTLFAVKGKRGAKRVAVLGEMGELGKGSAKAHERVGALVAQLAKISESETVLVCVGRENAPLLASGAEKAKASRLSVRRADTIEAAIHNAGLLLKSGDVVLLKGSRLAGIERVLEPLIHGVAAAKKG